MTMHFRLFLLLLLLPIVGFTQMSGRGKLITVEGDTIQCIIEIQQKQFCDVVKYKKRIEDRFEKFPLAHLHRIIIEDKMYENLFFIKRDIQGGNIYTCKICLCLVDGFVKLYKESITMFYHGANGIVNNNAKPTNSDVYYMLKGNADAEEIHPKYFVKQLKKTFVEYSEVVELINESKYNSKDIIKIIEEYNNVHNPSPLQSSLNQKN